MIKFDVYQDLKACEQLWKKCIPQAVLTDLWEVRDSFRSAYQFEPFFVVARKDQDITGFLPLAWISEKKYYGYFPGELWNGATWLEQNRILARDQETYVGLIHWLNAQDCSYQLRYLVENKDLDNTHVATDEIGYLFFPDKYDYKMENYYATFSHKSIKSILKEVKAFESQGIEYIVNKYEDLDWLIETNILRFKETSYFSDVRFERSIRNLVTYLSHQNALHMVTVLIEGKKAAVDVGCIYNNVYTLIAGATHADFPGIAKVINLYHMRKSCEDRFDHADFLCGDFFWKKMFHLSPRPLFQLSNCEIEH